MAVAAAAVPVSVPGEVVAKPNEALRRNRRRRAIHRLPFIEWIRGAIQIIAQSVEIGRACVPCGNSIRAAVGDVKVGGSNCGAHEKGSESLKCLGSHAGMI